MSDCCLHEGIVKHLVGWSVSYFNEPKVAVILLRYLWMGGTFILPSRCTTSNFVLVVGGFFLLSSCIPVKYWQLDIRVLGNIP